jgi:predicted dehydrogenase
MADSVRILQAGFGNRGRMWSSIVSDLPGAEIATLVDPDPQAREAFEIHYPGVPTFADLGAALDAERFDLALLVTPPDGRLAQAKTVFASGLPLLAEKPLSLGLADAIQIVRLAEEGNLPLAVALNFRYLPVSQKLRDLLADGAVGEPGFGQFVYQRNRDGRRPGLNKYPLTMRHPMMLEQSIHHLDLIRYCYGREAERVMCRTWNPSWSMYAHDSNVHGLLTLEGGLEVNYLGTWTSGWNNLHFSWRTDCSGGVILQRQLFSDLALARTEDQEPTPIALPEAEPFRDDTKALLQAFLAALRDGAAPPCSGRDHLQTLALCFAAIKSAETGREVDLRAFARRIGIEG